MIVVTGATGKLGRLVVDALLHRVPEAELAVAVRTPSKAADLSARGVQVRHADYDRPETLSGAFKPGEKVLLISANEVGKRAAQHLRVIEAARAASVGLLAYTSLLRADRSTLILAEEHRTTEEAIRASGLPYVLLRNGWYLENHTEQLDGILERGEILGAAGGTAGLRRRGRGGAHDGWRGQQDLRVGGRRLHVGGVCRRSDEAIRQKDRVLETHTGAIQGSACSVRHAWRHCRSSRRFRSRRGEWRSRRLVR